MSDGVSDAEAKAVEWRLRLAADGVATSPVFEFWLAASQQNAEAWAKVEDLWAVLDASKSTPQALELRRAARDRAQARRGARRQMTLGRVAATAVVVVCGVLGGVALGSLRSCQTITTPWNARKVVELEDGSRLTLDASTRVQVRLRAGERSIELLQGQARFDVAHDPSRPFRVHANGRTVTALGTSFTVDRAERAVTVTLLQGRVAVQDDRPAWRLIGEPDRAQPAVLSSGQRLSIGDAGEARGRPIESVSVSQATAWEAGKLMFSNEPLTSAAERVSRYSAHRITVGDAKAAEIRLSGVFAAGDAPTFVEAVSRYYQLDALVRPSGDIVLQSRPQNSP